MTSGADFYTGLVARIYGPLRSEVPDPRPYGAFIAASGEPALELGCGDGDPILDLRTRGVDVEGLDSSADMLERCQRAAADRGLEVTVHHGLMETMDLVRRYRSIYLAGPTFNLLADDTAAAQALGRIHAHLEPGGSALIPLFVPELTPAHLLGKARTHTTEDGTVMRFTVLADERNEADRTQASAVRYELQSPTEDLSEDRSWRLHWYGQEEFRTLAEAAGLRVAAVLSPAGGPAPADADTFVFWLTAPND